MARTLHARCFFKMAAIRGVMVDLSGTLHIDNAVIPGSIEALKRYFVALFRFINRL